MKITENILNLEIKTEDDYRDLLWVICANENDASVQALIAKAKQSEFAQSIGYTQEILADNFKTHIHTWHRTKHVFKYGDEYTLPNGAVIKFLPDDKEKKDNFFTKELKASSFSKTLGWKVITPIFTTYDGKKLYEGDKKACCFSLNRGGQPQIEYNQIYTNHEFVFHAHPDFRHFSTVELAETDFYENRDCLNIKDAIVAAGLASKTGKFDQGVFYQELYRMVTKK